MNRINWILSIVFMSLNLFCAQAPQQQFSQAGIDLLANSMECHYGVNNPGLRQRLYSLNAGQLLQLQTELNNSRSEKTTLDQVFDDVLENGKAINDRKVKRCAACLCGTGMLFHAVGIALLLSPCSKK